MSSQLRVPVSAFVGSRGSTESVKWMCVVDVNQSCQGPKPQSHGKMAKPSSWVRLGRVATSSFGVRVDVDWVCQNSHGGFLSLDVYDLKSASTLASLFTCTE